MKLMRVGLLSLAGFLPLWLVAAASGAVSYSNSLTGFTGDSSQAATQTAVGAAGMSIFGAGGPEAVTFDASGAHFGAITAGDAGRNYMRTTISDFATVPFTAEITFDIADDKAVFFGIGTGDTALFGTPDWSTLFSSASYWPETTTDKFTQFKTANDTNAFVDTNVAGFSAGTHRFRMTYNPATTFLVGSIDVNYAGGPFVADVTGFPMVLGAPLGTNPTGLYSADGWPSEPSRIFFGGDDGAVFRDLVINVVPEPNTFVLLLFGVLAIGRGRFRYRA
jgi:hypothetical protein